MTLRINKIEVFLVNMPLRFSIKHALHNRTNNTTGFIILSDDEGNVGIGEFLCRDYVTGENIEDSVQCLQQISQEMVKAVVDNPVDFIKSIWNHYADKKGKYGAICALELALFDIWSKKQGKSIAEFLCPDALLKKKDPRYSAVFPLATGFKFFALQLTYRVLQVENIKIKGVGQVKADLAYVTKIRNTFSCPVNLRLDLNGSLSPNHAEEYFSKMLESKNNIRWFEQPFSKDDWGNSEKFQKKFASDFTFCADESVCSMEDVERAIRTGAFRAINIRIAKNGGLLKALELYKKATESGLETQLGCYVGESSILAYAGLHFSSMIDQLRYHEGCFGNYLNKWDVIQPSLTFTQKGQVSFKRLPQAGLVPSFNLDRLRKKAFKTHCFT